MRVEFYGKEGTLKEMVIKYAKSYLVKTEIFKLKPDMSFKDFII